MENSWSVVLEGVEYKQSIHYSDLVQNFLLHNSYMMVLGAVSKEMNLLKMFHMEEIIEKFFPTVPKRY